MCNPMGGKFPTPYATACLAGQIDVVRYLTEERHCDPLYKDTGAKGALSGVSVAAAYGKVDILKYFVEERRCDLKASGVYDETLTAAMQCYKSEAVMYLHTIGTSGTTSY